MNYTYIRSIKHVNEFQMFTDALFHCDFDIATELSSPVQSYIYDYQNTFLFNTLYGWSGKFLGATHSDELNSLFKLQILNPSGLSDQDKTVSKLMVNIWSNCVSSK